MVFDHGRRGVQPQVFVKLSKLRIVPYVTDRRGCDHDHLVDHPRIHELHGIDDNLGLASPHFRGDEKEWVVDQRLDIFTLMLERREPTVGKVEGH